MSGSDGDREGGSNKGEKQGISKIRVALTYSEHDKVSDGPFYAGRNGLPQKGESVLVKNLLTGTKTLCIVSEVSSETFEYHLRIQAVQPRLL